MKPILAPVVLSGVLFSPSCVLANSRNSENLLGPTGMLAQPGKKGITITKVEMGSPADGRIRPGEVSFGVGSSGKPHPDSRRRLAEAMATTKKK